MDAEYRFINIRTTDGWVNIAPDCIESWTRTPNRVWIVLRMISGRTHITKDKRIVEILKVRP